MKNNRNKYLGVFITLIILGLLWTYWSHKKFTDGIESKDKEIIITLSYRYAEYTERHNHQPSEIEVLLQDSIELYFERKYVLDHYGLIQSNDSIIIYKKPFAFSGSDIEKIKTEYSYSFFDFISNKPIHLKSLPILKVPCEHTFGSRPYFHVVPDSLFTDSIFKRKISKIIFYSFKYTVPIEQLLKNKPWEERTMIKIYLSSDGYQAEFICKTDENSYPDSVLFRIEDELKNSDIAPFDTLISSSSWKVKNN